MQLISFPWTPTAFQGPHPLIFYPNPFLALLCPSSFHSGTWTVQTVLLYCLLLWRYLFCMPSDLQGILPCLCHICQLLLDFCKIVSWAIFQDRDGCRILLLCVIMLTHQMMLWHALLPILPICLSTGIWLIGDFLTPLLHLTFIHHQWRKVWNGLKQNTLPKGSQDATVKIF